MKLSKNRNPAVPGFKAVGLSCGIKAKNIKDLALIVSDVPATAAGVFTKNRVVSPGVTWSRRALAKSGSCRAIVINSGNANTVVGPKGMKDCDAITKIISEELSIPQKEVLIASTGVIGVPLPSEKILQAAPELVKKLGRTEKSWTDAAEAIMTTDLVSKSDRVQYTFKGKRITIGGITKGSGMIHPDMATMLGFLHTDAVIDSKTLKMALIEAASRSFNRITVDGDNSTNDCVIVLANGEAKNPAIKPNTPGYREFLKALTAICKNLASKIILDGEGATKFVTVRVQGGKTRKQAYLIANSVATSSLVKTALFGEDPNWGRIFCAVGNAGAPFDPDKVDIVLNKNLLVKSGNPTNLSPQKLVKAMRQHEINITIDLHDGKEWEEVLTCDFSYDYVKINAEYTT
ncbi:MAG: bifunctional glutamate N-acetyltransferase/amino-acid acetyltransferase ArgJ [Nitrospinae bacterium]|nr:bifunctional glutamate N-acetyltransferase/amino-acid acetyltransferase ArgJ [Nitrospinota bacterium]MBL7020360.1 bifunctional glutamate N-acetyltransferase/amino-acid acetyltransferase ArgJ [Nitrospinaceae bacterium]